MKGNYNKLLAICGISNVVFTASCLIDKYTLNL